MLELGKSAFKSTERRPKGYNQGTRHQSHAELCVVWTAGKELERKRTERQRVLARHGFPLNVLGLQRIWRRPSANLLR